MSDVQDNTGQTTEVKDVSVSETTTEQSIPSQLSDVEQKAYDMGWRPKDEYGGQHFVPAEEYVNRAPLFERIERQSKEIRELKDLVKESTSHLSFIRKDAYDRALQDLEQKQQSAEDSGDIREFKEATAAAEALKLKMQQDPIINRAEVKQDLHQDTNSFIERNKSWYNVETNENKRMVDAAFQFQELIRAEAAERGENLSVKDLMNKVEQRIKINFPHKFENAKRSAPSAVGKSTGTGGIAGLTGLARHLSPTQLKAGQEFHKWNADYTLDKYAADLDKAGRLNKK